MNIVLGISSSIAIYKSCELIRKLVKEGSSVQVIMTKNSTKLISPKTFSVLSQKDVYCDLFSKNNERIDHIFLSKWSDCLLVAPATANIIGKFASGIADDFLSTYYLANNKKTIIAPAMNTNMWENPAILENIEKLKKRGNIIIEPQRGLLACGDEGIGKMADIEDIYETLKIELYEPKIFSGKKIVLTAGPTREFIDKVRFISNPSSGKMGYSIARVAKKMGADVVLLSGKVLIKPPYGVETKYFDKSEELLKLLKENLKGADFLIMAAAVGDFKPPYFNKKIKRKEKLTLNLYPTKDILKEIRKDFNGFILGFAAEEENLEEEGAKKLKSKDIDAIFVNDISKEGIGFESDENEGIFISKNSSKKLEKNKKEKIAEEILFEVAKIAKLA
jgi:phosphopantothenoylcysteine decarboxylase/phosphopantothenate--cysteine ligase